MTTKRDLAFQLLDDISYSFIELLSNRIVKKLVSFCKTHFAEQDYLFIDLLDIEPDRYEDGIIRLHAKEKMREELIDMIHENYVKLNAREAENGYETNAYIKLAQSCALITASQRLTPVETLHQIEAMLIAADIKWETIYDEILEVIQEVIQEFNVQLKREEK